MQISEFSGDYKQQNPWWETSDVTESNRHYEDRRSDYHYKLNRVRSNRFVTLAGASGSGKTTILHQIAHDLTTEDEVPAENVMYLPLGDPRFQVGSDVIVNAVDEFTTYYRRRDSGTDGYVLIDDAHATQSWNEQVRACLRSHEDLTIVVTLPTLNRADIGSIDGLDLETATDLLLPPKFYDVVTEAHGVEVEKEIVRAVRDGLSSSAESGGADKLRDAVEDVKTSIDAVSGIKRGVLDYLGGAAREVGIDEVRRNLELTVYRDIPRYQQFEDRSDLHALCAIAAMYPGRTLGLKNLSEVLDCDRRTLQRYIDILKDFFILTPSYQYKYERRRSVKLYVRDPLLIGALTDVDLTDLLNSEAETRLMKTVVFDHLKRLAFYYHRSNEAVRFWESGTESIDFVIETGQETPIPIVISDIGERESAQNRIESFCKKYECEFGVTVARDVEPAVDEGVATLPLWLFLLFI